MLDSNLTSSTIAENDYAAYVAGTTYALGDRVILVSPASTVTMTIASPVVVSWTAHGLPSNTPVVFTTTGLLPTGLSTNVVYYVVLSTVPEVNTFKVSATPGGTPLNTSGTQSGTHTTTAQIHKIYESLQAANVGHYPPTATSSTWWIDAGPTNRWKMFDSSITSQASNANSIVDVIATSGRVDSVVFLNVSAATIRVVVTDAADGVVYDTTTNMTATSGIQDWYAYLYEPIERNAGLVLSNLPIYNSPSITVTLTDTGSTVLCGGLIVGLSKNLGDTEYGIKTGIQDYSVKTRGTFGDYSVLARAFNNRADYTFYLESGLVDKLQNLLASYRATPIVYVGSENYNASVVYGFYKNFDIDIGYLDGQSICTLQVEGLT